MSQDRPLARGSLAGLMVALVLLALVLSGLAFLTTRGGKTPESGPDPALLAVVSLEEEVISLREDLEGLRDHLRKLEAEVASIQEEGSRSVETASRVDGLASQMQGLSREIDSLERMASKASSRKERDGERASRLRAKNRSAISRFLRQATEPEWSLRDRVEALEKLRKYQSRTPEVARSMMALLLETTDPEMRARILAGLRGLQYMEMVPEILRCLMADADEGVRREAALTLAIFHQDESVREALQETARTDPSGWVRAGAKTALTGGDGK